MPPHRPAQETEGAVDDDAIRDYLIANPDFLQRHSDLLNHLQVPHPSGEAISLVERQVSVLRERNVDLRHRLRDLDSIARDNDSLFAGTRQLVLALLDAKSPAELQRALYKVLRDAFDTEYAALLLFTEEGAQEEQDGALRRVPESELRGRLSSLLRGRSSGRGALRPDDFGYLFNDTRLVGSAAMAVIETGGRALGLFAVGSSDARRYDSDVGTLFLEFIAQIIGRLLTGFEPEAT